MKNLNNKQPETTNQVSNTSDKISVQPQPVSLTHNDNRSVLNTPNDPFFEKETSPEPSTNVIENASNVLLHPVIFQAIEVNPKATRKEKALYDMFIKHFELLSRFTDHEFNLKHAAREIGTNEKYLSSAINNCTGMSFNKIVNKYRIEFAKKLIHDDILTRHNLEEIAYMSGYGNRTTFYRVFTETIGITPSRFRDNLNRGVDM